MADVGDLWPELPELLAFLESLTSKVWTVQMASTAAAQPQAAAAQAPSQPQAAQQKKPAPIDLTFLNYL